MNLALILTSLFSIAFSKPTADQVCGKQSIVPEPTIIGGRNVEEGEFPWQVSIGFVSSKGSIGYTCGGAILSKNTVLTAGHCVVNRSFNYIILIN